ncbi:hypothetical protein ACH5RR_008126 [Cinchona calisaya]|uniref:Uncharacterized protein n=1 Tax=Cinchona calisaya TaxID=153742 RepID=A0ABD3AAW0_9GENT
MLDHWKSDAFPDKFERLVFAITIYQLWHARNGVEFDNQGTLITRVVQMIVDAVRRVAAAHEQLEAVKMSLTTTPNYTKDVLVVALIPSGTRPLTDIMIFCMYSTELNC